MNFKQKLWLVVLFLNLFLVKAQVNLHFKNLGVNDGLSQTSVGYVLQDSRGYIWISTYDGLNKYDGYSFKIYRNNPRDPYSIISPRVHVLAEDDDGSIWISTNKGISHYDPKSDKFFNFPTDTSSLFYVPESVNYFGFVNDDSGNVWVGSDSGFIVIEKHTNTVSRFYPIAEDSVITNENHLFYFTELNNTIWAVSQKSIFTIDLDNRKVSIISTDMGGGRFFHGPKNSFYYTEDQKIFFVDQKSNQFKELRFINSNPAPNRIIAFLYTNGNNLDIFNNYWLAGAPFELTDSTAKYINHPTGDFWPYSAWGFAADRTGNIWAGFEYGGLYTDNYYNSKFQTYLSTNPYLDNSTLNSVWSVCAESDSVLWLGCETSVIRLNYLTGNSTNYSIHDNTNSPFKPQMSFCCQKTKDGNIWICSRGSLTEYNVATKEFTSYTHNPKDTSFLPFRNFNALIETSDGKLWMSAWNGGLIEFDRETKKIVYRKFNESIENALHGVHIWNICETSDGALWIGTRKGLNRFDRKTETFTHFFDEGKSKYHIANLYESPDHFLWFATNTDGLFKYDYVNNKVIKQYTTADGLPNNCIYRIQPDTKNNLWLSTNNGISKFNITTETFENFTHQDGLLSNEFNSGASAQTPDGKIIFGSAKGITLFHPEKMDKNPYPPYVVIRSLSVHNKPVSISATKPFETINMNIPVQIEERNDSFFIPYDISYVKELQLNYDQNFLTFEFVGLHYARPQKNAYAYKLEGLESEWNYVETRRYATYTDLKPGTYTLQVKAANSDGIWSEPVSMKINIQPPFWATWWFRFSLILFVALSVYFLHRLRTKSLIKRKEELEDTVTERTAQIVLQKEIIEEKHKEINDSIQYAERIQRSFLAKDQMLEENLQEYFVYFNPKEAVSGDFYWSANLTDNQFCLAVADSTGHGVPGAIMSILNITCLEKSVEIKSDAAAILNKTRELVIDRLKKDGSENGGKDGMDVALIIFNREKSKLNFALANNPLWLIRTSPIPSGTERDESEGHVLIEYRPDKMPVGKHDKQNIPFKNHSIDIQKGDLIYILTDGFADQFGGDVTTGKPGGKKFKYATLKELLLKISNCSMAEQKEIINSTFQSWKGDLEQVDDVCILGIRV